MKFNIVYLSLGSNLGDKINNLQTTINLIDSLGRIVKEKVLNNNSSEINERIDLRDLSKGIYFVKITQGNFSQVKKIVH